MNEHESTVDVLIVGGGIHGVGVAQAAAAAGYEALLLEAREVAAGTSSRSSKLIHGGLRYLESWQLGLVRESLRERAILCRIAPDLVRLVPFFVPVYRETSRRPWELRAGLSLYALLGNLRSDAWFRSVPRSAWDQLDGLVTSDLQAVFRYYDGQTDDAHLSRAVLRSAEELGARSVVPGALLEARRQDSGYSVRYRDETGDERTLGCRTLVNAAGPWVEEVRGTIEPRMPGFELDLVAGTHIELEGQIERGIYYCEAPRDRRAVFVIPWKGRTMVGTTELSYRGDPARVEPTGDEVSYLEEVLHHYFPHHRGQRVDAWAGLRVLPRGEGAAFSRPRETTFVVDDTDKPRALAIYGGKLTGYRATAEKVMQRLAPSLPARMRRAHTSELKLTPDANAQAPQGTGAKRQEARSR